MTQCMRPIKPKILKTLSYGDKVYKYRNVLAKPQAVLLDEKNNTLFVVEHGSQKPPLSMQDELTGRLTAYVVTRGEKWRFRPRKIRLYLAVGDHTQIEIDPQLADTRQLIDQWQAHRRSDHADFEWIPVSVLAMSLSQNTWLTNPPFKGV